MAADRRVGVAVDFSACSREALRWAVDNLVRDGVHLILVNVQKEVHYEEGEMQLWEATGSPFIPLSDLCDPGTAKKYGVKPDPETLDILTCLASQKKVVVVLKIYWGDAREKICEAIDDIPLSCLVIGNRGLGKIKRVILGGVTKYKRSAVDSEDEWPSKYSKVFLQLDDGLELSFTDKRRFARVRLLQDPISVPPISELGPDALLEPMKLDEFVESLSSKKTPIKALLLNQSYIAGIGNWVADEVLYQARIHPLQTAASLSREKCEVLHKCIKEVIHYAVEVDDDCSHFPVEWLFHFRWGKKSGKVNGKKIEFITVGGRTTAYVPELQKLNGTTSGKASGSTSKKSRSIKLSGDEVASDTKEDNDGEDEVDEDEGSHLKSKSRKGQKSQRISGTTKRLPAKGSSRVSPDNKEESGTEEDEDKEESGTEEMGNTRKPNSKKGWNSTGATEKAPLKKGGRSTPNEEVGQKKKTVRGSAKEQSEMKGRASNKRTKAGLTSKQQAKKRRK